MISTTIMGANANHGFSSMGFPASLIMLVSLSQVLDVSGAGVLSSAIPGSQVEILENCGHSVVMERPRKTAKLIMDFISSPQTTDNNKKHD